MLKKTLTAFTLSFLSLLGSGWENYAAQPSQKMSDAATGTLQKMIVESGSVAMDIDLTRLNGIGSPAQKLEALRFAVAPNSFFTILVFNNALRGPEFGSAMALIPQGSATLPAAFTNCLTAIFLPATEAEYLRSAATILSSIGRSRVVPI